METKQIELEIRAVDTRTTKDNRSWNLITTSQGMFGCWDKDVTEHLKEYVGTDAVITIDYTEKDDFKNIRGIKVKPPIQQKAVVVDESKPSAIKGGMDVCNFVNNATQIYIEQLKIMGELSEKNNEIVIMTKTMMEEAIALVNQARRGFE